MTENGTLTRRNTGFCQDDQSLECSFNADYVVTPGVYYPKKNRSPHRTRLAPTRVNKRAVFKNGEFNIEKTFSKRFYIRNWFVSMVDARWRWTLLNFCAAYTTNWLFFGFVYYIIALNHEDLTDDHLPHNQNTSNWTPCVENIFGFTSTFLFSVEVHTTVAYGRRSITLECPQAIIAMCLQCVLSSIFQAFMVGILFAKFTRPKARTQTILFSKNAVVMLRDEQLCLLFRVGDMRKSRILNIKASLFVIRMNSNREYIENFEQIELKAELDGCECSFFLWPVSVIHVIDENSPLHKISAADLLCGKLELLAVFEGTIETTGQPVQARTSYTGKDILWGNRFAPMIEFDHSRNIYDVDFSKLSETEEIDTPLCSAFEYKSIISVVNSMTDISELHSQ